MTDTGTTIEGTPEVLPIVQLMRALSFIGKDGVNEFYNYQYRGIDQMIAAIGPVLRDLGMFLSTEVVDWQSEYRGTLHHTVAKFRFNIYSPDGTLATTFEGLGEGADKDVKGSYKAASGAAKYALGHGLMIPFEADDPDKTEVSQALSFSSAAPVPTVKDVYAAKVRQARDAGVELDAKWDAYGTWDEKTLRQGVNKLNGMIAEAE